MKPARAATKTLLIGDRRKRFCGWSGSSKPHWSGSQPLGLGNTHLAQNCQLCCTTGMPRKKWQRWKARKIPRNKERKSVFQPTRRMLCPFDKAHMRAQRSKRCLVNRGGEPRSRKTRGLRSAILTGLHENVTAPAWHVPPFRHRVTQPLQSCILGR